MAAPYEGQGVHNGVHCNNFPASSSAVACVDSKNAGSGGVGDYLYGVMITPGTTSPGAVTITDGSISIAAFIGGASSVASLVPFFFLVDAKSINGPWKITTGTNVTALATGQFS